MDGELKTDIVRKAFKACRISGLTSNPTPEEYADALQELELMANEFFMKEIYTGYNFEDDPELTSYHNIPKKYWAAYYTTLAIRLLSEYGKEPTSALINKHRAAYSAMMSSAFVVNQVDYPARQPMGSGNRPYPYYDRYYPAPEAESDNTKTYNMYVDDVEDFEESFADYLKDTETVSSYTLEVSDGITSSSESLSSPIVSYTITAVSTGLKYVKIVATTSDSRVTTRIIQINVNDFDV